MNNLSNSSFQGVLDSIIRSYLLNELPPEVGESNNVNVRHTSAERDLGITQAGIPNEILQSLRRTLEAQGILPHSTNNPEVNNNDGQNPGTSSSAAPEEFVQGGGGNTGGRGVSIDQEYIKALYQCFEKRGVFKELQTFLRHKLVSILQDEFPTLQQSSSNPEQNVIVFRLVEDFLRCHKLLYTLSVLASEGDVKPSYTSSRAMHGKLSGKEAEDLLDELGIKRLSRLSGQILKCYFDKENFSLLESMHYLGIWLDGQAFSWDHVKNSSDKGKFTTNRNSRDDGYQPRKGHHSLNVANKIDFDKTHKPRKDEADDDLSNNRKNESIKVEGVERRLAELEKRLEKEKDKKIAEAIERFKEEELQRYKNELETKMNLKLIEKEKEYLVQMQNKLEGINEEVHNEKQGWLQTKLKQEKELFELRKQLTDKMISRAKMGILTDKNITSSRSRKFNKSVPDHYLENVEDSEGPEIEMQRNRNKSSCLEAIQMDKLVFLQYRLEQQEEEIKSLRRQLILSPHLPQPSTSKSMPTVEDRNRGAGDADVIDFIQGRTEHLPRSNGKLDDLEAFLLDSKSRLEKLDNAAAKIDEIFNEVTVKKRREATPLLSERLSARAKLSSQARNRPILVSQYPPGVYNVEMVDVEPSMHSFSLGSTLAPLSRQQLPEKQVTFVPKDLSNFSMPNNLRSPHNLNNEFRQRVDTQQATRFAAPPTPTTTVEIEDIQNREVQTPVGRQFPVSYGNLTGQHNMATKSNKDKRKSQEAIHDNCNSKRDAQNERLNRRVSKPSNPVTSVQIDNNSSYSDDNEGEEKVEESLFHLAATQSTSNIGKTERKSSSGSTSEKNNLREKALRHGALLKEKVTSSEDGDVDDDENSKSISIAESIQTKLLVKSRSNKKPLQGNNQNGALSKVMVDENGKALPVKVVPNNGEPFSTAGPHFSKALLQEFRTRKERSASSSTSSSPLDSKKRNYVRNSPPKQDSQSSGRGDSEQGQNDLSSLSISVPKSDNEDENNDFWKL